jgi:hypothetical protein
MGDGWARSSATELMLPNKSNFHVISHLFASSLRVYVHISRYVFRRE